MNDIIKQTSKEPEQVSDPPLSIQDKQNANRLAKHVKAGQVPYPEIEPKNLRLDELGFTESQIDDIGQGLNDGLLTKDEFVDMLELALVEYGATPEQKRATHDDWLYLFKDDYADSPGETDPVGNDVQTEPIKYQSLVDVKPCKVDWLIDGWIPKRGVTLIAGQPGAGKTTLALSLATACSTGGFWGVKSVEKGKVILYCGEDTYPEIIAPNLIAQGADLKMIQRPIAGLNDDGESESFNPGKHMARLQESLRTQKDVKLIILDPALEIASKARDEYRANDIRQALAPVQRLAEIHNLAIVCITHFLKRHNATGSNVLDRVIGSQAWGAVSRMVLGVEQQREGEARVCMRVKSNWGKASGGFYFFIKPENIGDGINGKAIEFGDSIDGKADQVMGNNSTPKDAPKTNVASDWLIQYLAQYPDGVGWNDAIKDAIDDADITKSTLRNARDTLKNDGVITGIRLPGHGGKTVWKLAEE